MKKGWLIYFISLFVFVSFSVIWFFNAENRFTDRSLFFVEPVSRAVVMEHRLIAEKHDTEKNIELLVKDALLGSSLLVRDNIFPERTRLNQLLYRNDIVYADLSIEAVLSATHTGLSFEESTDILRRTISFNFPSVKGICITVNGNLPR